MRPATIAPVALATRIDALEAAGTALRAMGVDARVAALDRLATRWLQPGFAPRRRALAALPVATGYAPGAIRHAIDHLWAALSARELAAVVACELGSGAPERLAFHSLAGNIPGAGVFGIVAALLAGVPSVVKTAEREPLLPALLAETLAATDPRIAAALTVVHWPGGSEPHQALVAARASVVLAYGGEESVAAIAARAPQRVLRFGPRLSVALVCREATHAHTAAVAARQIALFDQHGCLSPQYVLVEEADPSTTDGFVAALVESLRRLAVDLPRAPLSLEEAMQAWHYLERQRWREQEGDAVRVLADTNARFSVVCDRSGVLPASPLNRHVIVLPVPDLERARGLLERLAGRIEALGVAAPSTRLGEAAALATAYGAHRMCPLERMQAPLFSWRQSGHARIASLMTPGCAATVETSVPASHAAHRSEAPRERRPPLSDWTAPLLP